MIISILSRTRWLTSIFLLIMVDVCTFLAFHKTTAPNVLPHGDKLLHFLAFVALFLVGYLALRLDFMPRTKRGVVLLGLNWFIWAAYGALLELGQSFFSYRQADFGDFLADLLGLAVGTLGVLLSKPVKPSREAP